MTPSTIAPANTLIIMSDEHSRKVMGAYGSDHVITPNLDALAARGTLFRHAYCNSPICVPSRASFHTGLYPHQIRLWDNAMPYAGEPQGWAHRLAAAGREVTSIGKLHFRDASAPTGFTTQILPLHVKDGIGDPTTLLRRDPPRRPGTKKLPEMTGKGTTPYWDYDCAVAEAAEAWIAAHADRVGWTAFVSFVLPHFPLNAPERFRSMYEADALPYPKANAAWQAENLTSRAMRALLDFQDHFVSEGQIREAVAQYYALTTALDENVGRVLRAIEETGAADDTLVIYASDHGDNLGNRGHWGKSTMWEESVGVPLVIAGPGITAGATCDTPVSLIDLAPTVEAAGGLPVDESLPGRDLRELARDRDPDRPVFAEYHAVGAETGIFMLRLGSYKLIEFVGDAPLLYDLEADPEELVNLAEKPDHRDALERCRAALHAICDSVAVNAQAFRDQAARVKHLGGEASVRRRQPLAFTDPSAGAYRAP